MSGLTFSGDVVVYLLGLAATWGAVMWRITALEKKVDRHNSLVERMYVVEQQSERNEGRIKELEALHPRMEN